jgi:hypothetical protein
MIRNVRLGLAFATVLVLAACGEVPTVAGDGALQRTSAAASIVPGTCTNLTALNALAATLFTPTSSPNINSVKGKLKNLDGLVRRGKIEDAKRHASEIVAFTLLKHNQGGLAGTAEQVEAFTDAVLCFAGFDLDVDEPTDSYFILPSDEPQVVTNSTGTAGIAFDANPVAEPTLVQFALIEDVYPAPGAGPLDTKLDQYPGFILITKTSETNAPLTKPAVVGVCATGVIPQEVRDRLRLGHGASLGFEITPAATADFISCPNQTAQAPAATGWNRVLELLMPAKAHAFQDAFGGGVGGTVTEFSPFAPVDPELQFGGGVGGTVTEFTRMGFKQQSALLDHALAVAGTCSTPIEGAEGSPLREECRPYVTLSTRLGTPFTGVPVTWEVTLDGGSVAANTGTCDSFGSSASTATGINGRAGICWTLGAVGANQVRATPSLGGDAVDGVSFSPAFTTFDAIANPPAGLMFSLQPPAVVRAGVGFPAAVTIVDKNGERVWASTANVALRLDHGAFINGITSVNAKALAGIASFPALPVVDLGVYQLVASAPFLLPPAELPRSSSFEVVPAPPYLISIQTGDGQTGLAGQLAPVAPVVRVTDRWGHVVVGTTIRWRSVTSSGTFTLGTSATDADGVASFAWTLLAGTNQLRSELTEGSLAFVLFNATGISP